MNAALGRMVLDHVTANPRDLDMCVWAANGPCGTSACIAGWALVMSGWEVAGDNVFRRPDGTEVDDGEVIAGEARTLLGLGVREFWRRAHGPDADEEDRCTVVSLFTVGNREAVDWLRELVEAAEREVRREP